MPTKSTTLDEALLRTLAVRKRLIESKLIFFTQLRFARDTKVKTLPTQKAVREALAVARKRGLIVRLSTGRYELSAGETKKADTARVKAAKAKPKKAPPRKEMCVFPSTDLNAFAKVEEAISKRFEVFAREPDSVAFRWRHTPERAGPDFRAQKIDRAEAVRGMRAWQRSKLAKHEPKVVSFVALTFDDLDHVLDETNGLIEAQHVMSKATGGPMFLAWNKKLIASTGEEITLWAKL